MNDKQVKKRIRIYSVIAIIAALTSILTGSLRDILFGELIDDTGWVIALSASLNFLAFMILFSLVLSRNELTPKLEKKMWISLPVLLVPIIPGAIFDIIPLAIVPSVLIILILGVLVFFSPERSTRRILILLAFMIFGFFMKRQHWPMAGVLITLTLGILVVGSIIYGIHILQKHKENLYFRIIGSICFLLIALQSLTIMFKFQHWPVAGIFVLMAGVPTLVTTLLVLITLPGSGFINWKKEQQKILTRKILIPWIFLLLFMGLKTLLPPPAWQRIFEKDIAVKTPFDMAPYAIEMKDGMEEGD